MDFTFSTENIDSYHNQIDKDSSNRYNSWKHCFKAFDNIENDNDYLALHLAFYLASWGMYRGSTGLLQKDYKIHIEAVKIIKEFIYLRCNQSTAFKKEQTKDILILSNELKSYYGEIPFLSKKEIKNINPTDTLISKILLGTLGCSPAFDRYFIDGVKLFKFKFTALNQSSFDSLFDFVHEYSTELIDLQNKFSQKDKYYPIFKLVDMYFWQEGFNLEKNKETITP